MTESAELDRHLSELQVSGAGVAPDDAAIRAAVRSYVEALRLRLEHLHRCETSGRIVNETHADLIDRLVRRLFERAEADYFADGLSEIEPVAVVAVGGYARREMAIHSDVDLLVLHLGSIHPYVRRVAESLQQWLWDARLTVGCAIRSIPETLELARSDATVATAILDTRFLAGKPQLFHRFDEDVGREVAAGSARFVAECVEALRERHARFGDSLYLLEPNVKEGVGALRDYHTALWTARAAYGATHGLEDFLRLGLLTEAEMESYRAALDFLWRSRNELHLRARRRNDQMSFERQEEIAEAFGYDAAATDGALAVERFMGDYYRHARVIQSYSQMVIEQSEARARDDPAPSGTAQEVEEGFRLIGRRLTIPHAAHLRERPVRLLLAFAVAQDHDVELSRTAQRTIRENIALLDERMRTDPEVIAAWLRILDSERRVMRTLVTMNELGLLGQLLPEWEHIVCRWQHVVYHTYTVDVHSIFLVEELRRLWRGKYEKALPDLTELVREVDDRPVLFLGCLLHDIGKGRGGDHSNRGAVVARACVERLGLSAERVDRVVFLVRHHLLMSHLAQRRDLSDPKLIYEFARTLGDRTNLRNLYLVTFADIRASSPGAWTEWKRELLAELFERTAEFLETGGDDPRKVLEQIEAQVEVRMRTARDQLRTLGVSEERIDAFFASLPRRYFVSHTPPQIARHALVAFAFRPERVAAISVREMRGGFSELIVCTRDVHGLYACVAGTLTARGINILASHVYTTRTGLALEVYRVSTPPGGKEERELSWGEFENTLLQVLRGEAELDALLARRRRSVGSRPSLSRRAPTVAISNSESHFYTIVDVSTDDRLGLLYDLTRTLAAHGLEIYISKAATILDQVADTFYVKTVEGKKLTDPERIEALHGELLVAATPPEESDDG